MTAFAGQFLRDFLAIFIQASPYILFGFAVAACIQIFLPVRLVQRLLGSGRFRPVWVASLLGIPLPLCSCSVLPTALALRKRGASRAATISFLISTPETGVDSITLTYGLLGPLMAIYRPLSALVTALMAGFATNTLAPESPDDLPHGEGDTEEEDAMHPGCDCGSEDAGEPASDDELPEEGPQLPGELSFTGKLRHGFRDAFVDLFDRTSHWMFAGLLISALITVLIPAEVVTNYLSSGPVPLLVMLVIGIPMYICASGSTPIAAALVMKGLSPGAALVFLLAGPATNIGSLAILTSFLGRRVTVIYLSTIVVLSLALGGLLDVVHSVYGVDPQAVAGTTRDIPLWLSAPAAVVFAVLLFFSFRRTSTPPTLVTIGRGIERLLGIRITRRGVRQLAIGLVVVVCAATFFFTVPTGYQGLVRRFGAPTGPPRGEGLHLKWPPPIETVELVRTDVVRRIEIGFQSLSEGDASISWLDPATNVRVVEEEAYYLTGDENIIDTRVTVQYRVIDPERYVYGFSDPESVVKMETLTQLIENLAQMRIDGVYTDERRELEMRVIAGLERRAVELDLGIELLHLGVTSAHAPPEVHAAFRDVASAQEDKETAINVAYRYHDETINLAEGEAAGELESARSYATSQIKKSQGESQSLIEKAQAYRQRPVGTYTRLYLETMEQVLARGRKIIRPGWTGAGSVDLWISNGTGKPMSLDDVLAGSGATLETGSEGRSQRD